MDTYHQVMDPYTCYLHSGDTVVYQGETIWWGMERTGSMTGPGLTDEQAETINSTEELSLTCPDIRVNAPPQQTMTLTPDEVRIHKPVREGDTEVKFTYTGERRAPLQT